MRSNTGNVISPLDWPGLVEEALRRRRAENLTQKEHAALAGVSVPTMNSFERKETSLSIGKALDILEVVALVAKRTRASSQDAFVAVSEQRWSELTSEIPVDSPSHQPHGHYAIDYEIADTSASSIPNLLEALQQSGPRYSGWPPFWMPTRKAIAPYPFDGGIECWLGRPDAERAFNDAAHSDFWRAAIDARLYLRRGYQEDSVDVLAPATVFDLTLPVWRTAEIMLHAFHLARALKAKPDTEITFRVHYVGLAGRQLKSWANPHREVLDDHRCRTASAIGTASARASDIDAKLTTLVQGLLAPIYEQFDFFKLSDQLVNEELSRLRRGAVGRP